MLYLGPDAGIKMFMDAVEIVTGTKARQSLVWRWKW